MLLVVSSTTTNQNATVHRNIPAAIHTVNVSVSKATSICQHQTLQQQHPLFIGCPQVTDIVTNQIAVSPAALQANASDKVLIMSAVKVSVAPPMLLIHFTILLCDLTGPPDHRSICASQRSDIILIST